MSAMGSNGPPWPDGQRAQAAEPPAQSAASPRPGDASAAGPAAKAQAPVPANSSGSSSASAAPLPVAVAEPPARPIDPVDQSKEALMTYFHQFTPERDLDGTFTKVRKLATGIHGEVLLFGWTCAGQEEQHVVGKRIPTARLQHFRANRLASDRAEFCAKGEEALEDCATELGVYFFLRQQARCPNLLYMVGVKQERHKGIEHTLLLTEYTAGTSELFDMVKDDKVGFNDDDLRSVTWQLLQAVGHLHRLNIGHRDISLENVLCRVNESGQKECKLMDFGQAVLVRRPDSPEGEAMRYRFFSRCSKEYYRAPEMYIPRTSAPVKVMCPADYTEGRGPVQLVLKAYLNEWRFLDGAQPSQPSLAEPSGYAVAPADMFALGVGLFIFRVKLPPWQLAQLTDPSFAFVMRQGPNTLIQHWAANNPDIKPLPDQHAKAMLQGLLHRDPASRFTLQQCIDCAWFDELRNADAAGR